MVSRTIRPRPRMRVVVQHAGHDVLLVRSISAEFFASFVVVVWHVQSVVEARRKMIVNYDRRNIHQSLNAFSTALHHNWYVLFLRTSKRLQIYDRKKTININSRRVVFTSWLALMQTPIKKSEAFHFKFFLDFSLNSRRKLCFTTALDEKRAKPTSSKDNQ